jgi:hypothetical protein
MNGKKTRFALLFFSSSHQVQYHLCLFVFFVVNIPTSSPSAAAATSSSSSSTCERRRRRRRLSLAHLLFTAFAIIFCLLVGYRASETQPALNTSLSLFLRIPCKTAVDTVTVAVQPSPTTFDTSSTSVTSRRRGRLIFSSRCHFMLALLRW